MSNKQAIGLFDSGIGGLTVLKSVAHRLPGEDLIYFGDTARTPYGNKSVAAVERYARQITNFLIAKEVKCLVVACNTVSAAAIQAVREEAGDLPVFEVIVPMAETVIDSLRSKGTTRVGVLATRRTVYSNHYPRAFADVLARDRHGDVEIAVEQIACPLFVNLAEEGIWEGPVAEAVVDYYLAMWQEDPPDVVVLGCTHYPLLTPVLKKRLPGVPLLESGQAVAEKLAHQLSQGGLLNEREGKGQRTFYCTDEVDAFLEHAESFLGETVENAERVDWLNP